MNTIHFRRELVLRRRLTPKGTWTHKPSDPRSMLQPFELPGPDLDISYPTFSNTVSGGEDIFICSVNIYLKY